jgi:hypothetical protein
VIEYLLANADRIRLNVDAGNQNGATPLYISWYERVCGECVRWCVCARVGVRLCANGH